MQEEKKDLIKNVAAIALTTGLALVTQGTSNIALGVLSGISGNLASSYIEKTGYRKIRDLLRTQHPSELNHDLKKLILTAVSWTIRNIEILYKAQLQSKEEISMLRQFTGKLLDDVKQQENLLLMDTQSLHQLVENAQDPDQLFATFRMKAEDLPVIKTKQPFNVFFTEQFIPNLQLCFGELLKQEKNRPAFLAYQREVYQNLTQSIDTVIAQNNALLERTQAKTSDTDENRDLKVIRKLLVSAPAKKLNTVFLKSFDNQLHEISTKTDALLIKSDHIFSDLQEVKRIAIGLDQDLKKGWMQKKQAWMLISLAIAVAMIAGFAYYLYNLPFQMHMTVETDKAISVHAEYPALSDNAHLRVFLPDQTIDREITAAKEITLTNLSAELSGTHARIELIDPYWQLSSDSMKIHKGHVALSMMPNASLARIEGRVLSRDGQQLLAGARVSVDGIHGETDDVGRYQLEIPVSVRRLKYVIRVEHEGYETVEEEYISGSEKEIRLTQSSRK